MSVNWTVVDTVASHVYRLAVNAWIVFLLVIFFLEWLGPLTAIIALIATWAVDVSVSHVWCYGFHRRTPQQRWDEMYDDEIDTRDRFYRRTTIYWLIGLKHRAEATLERAEYAWLDAQVTLASDENPRNARLIKPDESGTTTGEIDLEARQHEEVVVS